jgi:hypothetical protein
MPEPEGRPFAFATSIHNIAGGVRNTKSGYSAGISFSRSAAFCPANVMVFQMRELKPLSSGSQGSEARW